STWQAPVRVFIPTSASWNTFRSGLCRPNHTASDAEFGSNYTPLRNFHAQPGQMSATESSSSSNMPSWQAINLAEVISVVLSILLVEWALAPFAVSPWLLGGPPLLAFLLMLYSHRCRGETLQTLGFGRRCFKRAL